MEERKGNGSPDAQSNREEETHQRPRQDGTSMDDQTLDLKIAESYELMLQRADKQDKGFVGKDAWRNFLIHLQPLFGDAFTEAFPLGDSGINVNKVFKSIVAILFDRDLRFQLFNRSYYPHSRNLNAVELGQGYPSMETLANHCKIDIGFVMNPQEHKYWVTSCPPPTMPFQLEEETPMPVYLTISFKNDVAMLKASESYLDCMNYQKKTSGCNIREQVVLGRISNNIDKNNSFVSSRWKANVSCFSSPHYPDQRSPTDPDWVLTHKNLWKTVSEDGVECFAGSVIDDVVKFIFTIARANGCTEEAMDIEESVKFSVCSLSHSLVLSFQALPAKIPDLSKLIFERFFRLERDLAYVKELQDALPSAIMLFTVKIMDLSGLSELKWSRQNLKKAQQAAKFAEQHADIFIFEAVDALSPRNMSHSEIEDIVEKQMPSFKAQWQGQNNFADFYYKVAVAPVYLKYLREFFKRQNQNLIPINAVPIDAKVRLVGFAKFSQDSRRTKFTVNAVPLRQLSDVVNFYTVMNFSCSNSFEYALETYLNCSRYQITEHPGNRLPRDSFSEFYSKQPWCHNDWKRHLGNESCEYPKKLDCLNLDEWIGFGREQKVVFPGKTVGDLYQIAAREAFKGFESSVPSDVRDQKITLQVCHAMRTITIMTMAATMNVEVVARQMQDCIGDFDAKLTSWDVPPYSQPYAMTCFAIDFNAGGKVLIKKAVKPPPSGVPSFDAPSGRKRDEKRLDKLGKKQGPQ